MHKKLFRCHNGEHFEVLFVAPNDKAPNGWYETREAAKLAYAVPVIETETVTFDTSTPTGATITIHDAPKRRGRPRKAESVIEEG